MLRKSLFTCSLLLIGSIALCQSKTNNYLQLSVGYNPKYNYANSSINNSMYYLSVEYGKSYKWLDVGISIDYENGVHPLSSNSFEITYHKETNSYTSHNDDSFSGIVNTSVRLNAKINLIRLFSETSRHALKLGGNYGIGFTEEINSYDKTSDNISWWYHSSYNWYGGYKLAYEYALTPNISIGAFLNKGKCNTYGVSIQRRF